MEIPTLAPNTSRTKRQFEMGYRLVATNCIVRVILLRGLSKQQAALCHFVREEAGRCWTDMLKAHIESRGGKWLSSVDLGKMFKGQYRLHSQTIQALAQKAGSKCGHGP
jgi:hypothetical protein